MADTPNRVALDRVDWLSVFPVLRLSSALRHALQPAKLLIAFIAVLLLHGIGTVMDLITGTADGGPGSAGGPYADLTGQASGAMQALLRSAAALELGLGESYGVVDALHRIFIRIPAESFSQSPWFTMVFGLFALLILGLSSGVICRMAASHICLGRGMSLSRAVRFTKQRWVWYLLTPLMPTMLILLVGGVLVLLGLVFFNLPVVDVVGALLYGVFVVLGFVIALVTLLLVFGLCLMAPSLSVEGTDGFDAIARSFNYVMYRPWQFGAYLLSAIVYAGVVYILVIGLAGLSIQATHAFLGVGAYQMADVTETSPTGGYDDTLGHLPDRQSKFERVAFGDPSRFSGTLSATAWIIRLWFHVLIAFVVAVMFSVICCLQTQVYVLIRRSADGTPLDDCAADDEQDPWSSPEDMVDPEAQAIAASGPGAGIAPGKIADPPTPEA